MSLLFFFCPGVSIFIIHSSASNTRYIPRDTQGRIFGVLHARNYIKLIVDARALESILFRQKFKSVDGDDKLFVTR